MKPSFTPGPWVIEPEAYQCVIAETQLWLIATQGTDEDISIEQDDANANLIAAAPDLYAALKAFVEYEEASARYQDLYPADGDLFGARAALRKAEGE